MFGRRFRFLFAPIPDTEGAGAPAGGGAPPPVVPAPPAGDAKPPAPPAASDPPVVPPTVDLESPAIKQLIAAAQAKAASEARLQALTEAKLAAEEAKRVAAMDAETRARHEQEILKQEAATAKGAATKAENAVAAAAREAAIFRQLALTGLVPHDEEVAAMVAAAAPATLVPGDTAWITKLAAARPYLFKAAEQKPGTASPAEIVAAGRTTVPAAPAAPAAPGAPRPNAHELSDDAWAKRKAELGIR